MQYNTVFNYILWYSFSLSLWWLIFIKKAKLSISFYAFILNKVKHAAIFFLLFRFLNSFFPVYYLEFTYLIIIYILNILPNFLFILTLLITYLNIYESLNSKIKELLRAISVIIIKDWQIIYYFPGYKLFLK